MCRVLAITARMLLSIFGVVGASVMSAPASALSHDEWVMAFVRFVEWPAASMGVESHGPVTVAADLGPAIKRGIEAVKRGNPYLIDVVTQGR